MSNNVNHDNSTSDASGGQPTSPSTVPLDMPPHQPAEQASQAPLPFDDLHANAQHYYMHTLAPWYLSQHTPAPPHDSEGLTPEIPSFTYYPLGVAPEPLPYVDPEEPTPVAAFDYPWYYPHDQSPFAPDFTPPPPPPAAALPEYQSAAESSAHALRWYQLRFAPAPLPYVDPEEPNPAASVAVAAFDYPWYYPHDKSPFAPDLPPPQQQLAAALPEYQSAAASSEYALRWYQHRFAPEPGAAELSVQDGGPDALDLHTVPEGVGHCAYPGCMHSFRDIDDIGEHLWAAHGEGPDVLRQKTNAGDGMDEDESIWVD